MQVSTSLQTDNHANTSPLSFLQAPNQQRQSTEGFYTGIKLHCLVTEAHGCEQLAHSRYTAVPPGWGSNPRPLDHKSVTPTQCLYANPQSNMLRVNYHRAKNSITVTRRHRHNSCFTFFMNSRITICNNRTK